MDAVSNRLNVDKLFNSLAANTHFSGQKTVEVIRFIHLAEILA